jgi:hypothetical protein
MGPVVSVVVLRIAIVAATLLVFDLLAYLFLPDITGLVRIAPAYRHTKDLREGLLYTPDVALGYPRYYHVADDTLGFDIARGAEGLAQIDNRRYQYRVFSNDLGCFSRHQRADYQTQRPYVYFAGDSFTWGFAAYESKFATVWEELTGGLAAPCGVTHSGQRHQFDKFTRVVAAIGVMPAVVVVGFDGNDPANDAAYPHTTVIDGYLVDSVFVKNHVLVPADRGRLERIVDSRIQDLQRMSGSRRGLVVNFLKVFSLSANILNGALHSGVDAARRLAIKPTSPSRTEHDGLGEIGDDLYSYFTADDTRARYANDVRADSNKAAILRWRDHASQNGYRLIFLLIPWKEHFGDAGYFAQVTSWMSANGVQFIDLTAAVTQSSMRRDQLYWEFDGHLNEVGNRMLGRYLAGIPELKPHAIESAAPAR